MRKVSTTNNNIHVTVFNIKYQQKIFNKERSSRAAKHSLPSLFMTCQQHLVQYI